jgi:hypothetical protein
LAAPWPRYGAAVLRSIQLAAGATGAAPSSPSGGGGTGTAGQNPFQICTNLYAEKNLQGLQTGVTAGATAQQFGGQVNAGQFLRGVHVIVRNSNTPSGISVINGHAIASTDGAFDVLANLDLINVDGSEILYNMSCYSHYLMQKYAKPWLKDRATAYDYTPVGAALGGSFTIFLQPEIRWTAGVLANTDTRSQYRFDYTLSAMTISTTAPTYNITPYMDAWAQPDANDLQGTPNQPVPPGVNLQVKRRHQIFTINAGSDNTILSTLTGNAIRCAVLVGRNSSNLRVTAAFADPIYWYLDNRSLGRLNPDIVRQWAEDQYASYALYGQSQQGAPGTGYYAVANNATDGVTAGEGAFTGSPSMDLGVAVFPRFIEPGELYGQGWLYTANSTKLAWETTNTAITSYELIVDEVYPVGNVDPTLVDI